MRPSRLLLLALLLVGLLFAAACGDGDKKGFDPSSDPAKNIPPDQLKPVNVVIAGSDWYVGENNFVFGITNAKDDPVGGAKTRVTFYDLRDPANPKAVFNATPEQSAPGVGPKTTHVHAGGQSHEHGGEDENRVGYFVKVNFNYEGAWGIAVEATLPDGTTGSSNVAFFVKAKPGVLGIGMKAHLSDNLTKKDVPNIKEIDSGDPPNDMHDVKIKDAIAAGRPLMVVFSTPAYCASRFCGPVTEELEALQAVYKDRVDFVHIEVWRDYDKQLFNPTAQEWLIRPDGGMTEPWVFAIDKKGLIYDRWEGPVARNILEPAVKAMAEGKTR